MSGNVDEWLWDWGSGTTLNGGALTDYRGLKAQRIKAVAAADMAVTPLL
jgi:hypothetical protein